MSTAVSGTSAGAPPVGAGPGRAEEATPRCSPLAREAGLLPDATASAISSVLLVEHTAQWPRDVLQRLLLPVVGDRVDELRHLWVDRGLRPLLIRRPTRRGSDRAAGSGPRTVIVGGCRPGRRWLERLEIADLDELRDLDLTAVAEGDGGIGEPLDAALLVCTHGSKDACCAVHGRPVVGALAAAYPEQTWECTHVGGDRWAGNVLAVPAGLMYAHADPAGVVELASQVLAGRVPLPGLRGRTGSSPAEQVVEITLRREHGWSGLDDVVARETGPGGGEATAVAADTPDGRIEAVVTPETLPECGPSACASAFHPVRYGVDVG